MNLELLPQLPNETIGEYAYRLLRKNILQANLFPGECLNPNEVAQRLQISRTPVHAAFTRLMNEGLVHIYPQRGSYVSMIDLKRLYESVSMRNLMDQAAIRLLCTHGTGEEGLMEMETNVNQQRFYFEKGMVNEVFELDVKLHEKIYLLAGMEHVHQAVHSICADQYRVRYLKLYGGMRWVQTQSEHLGIIDAIRQRDVQAGLRWSYEHVMRISVDLESVHRQHPDYFENWGNGFVLAPEYKMESFFVL